MIETICRCFTTLYMVLDLSCNIEVKRIMKSLIKYLVLIVIVLTGLSSCNIHNYENIEAYCYKINSVIKDMDFEVAKVSKNKISLYDDQKALINEMIFDSYEDNIKVVRIRKEANKVYFITAGSVDDERGVVFINDDSNAVLDGIKSIERIGGNSYYYSTKD